MISYMKKWVSSNPLILDEGHIERKIVADIYHNRNNSTFAYRKGESQYTLWEGKNLFVI